MLRLLILMLVTAGFNSSGNFVSMATSVELWLKYYAVVKGSVSSVTEMSTNAQLSKIKHLSNLQVVTELVEKIANSKIEDNTIVYFTKKISYGEDEAVEKLEKLNRCNSWNVSRQKSTSVKNCNGKNTSDTEPPGFGKYFNKMVSVCRRQTLEHKISLMKCRNTAWASFDAAMEYAMNLVKTRFAFLKLDG